jgi:hypothetical protein
MIGHFAQRDNEIWPEMGCAKGITNRTTDAAIPTTATKAANLAKNLGPFD